MASPAKSAYQKVSFAAPRSFATTFKAAVKETLFPDDPFLDFKNQTFSGKTKRTIQYFVPIFHWLPNYNLHLFRYDLLAGIIIASLAIPQGISNAKLDNVSPVIGLYSSFVPPLVYAVFGSSKHVAVGTVAACSLLISLTIGDKVNPNENPALHLQLVFTATFFAGLVQTAMGLLRLGILVDFLSHSTITGFMGGTAMLICLQQLKGMFGLKHFTTKTDVVSVLRSIFSHRNEWRAESVVVGVICLVFLQVTTSISKRKPKLFWVSAVAPIVVVVTSGLFAFFSDAEEHGIQIAGELKKGLNPLSVNDLNFDANYISAPLQAGIITAMVALAEGIAAGRNFAIRKNEQIDWNKEMIAFGLMNIVGSLTSCYLTTGQLSKTAVNFNAGCKTAMSNVVMSLCMMLTLLLLAPLFRYTPLVALSAIIMSGMFGLIKYKKAYHLFKTDKFDFGICMVAFFGVSFVRIDIGFMLSVGISILRALLCVARPASCKLGKVPNSTLYRDVEQYPGATELPEILVLQLGSPIYFLNCTYIRERILRWVRDEEEKENDIEHILLDLGGVTSIDITGVETLVEVLKIMEAREIKVGLVNPRLQVMEKLVVTNFIEKIGEENVYLSIEDAVKACRFSLKRSKQVDTLRVELCS